MKKTLFAKVLLLLTMISLGITSAFAAEETRATLQSGYTSNLASGTAITATKLRTEMTDTSDSAFIKASDDLGDVTPIGSSGYIFYNNAGAIGAKALNSTDMTEGGNLFYTNERVDDQVDVLMGNSSGLNWSYNDATGVGTFELTNVFQGDNTCATDVTQAAETFAEAHNGYLLLNTGCYQMADYNPDSNLYIIGLTPNVQIKAKKNHSAVEYKRATATDVANPYVSILSVKQGVSVNGGDDYLTRVAVADASTFTVGKTAHMIAQVGHPWGGTPHQILDITNATVGVVNYSDSALEGETAPTADTFANGDIVTLYNISGMTELNNRSFKVSNVNTTANTFELETTAGVDVNTTNYGAFAKGGIWYKTGASWKRVLTVTNANPPVVTVSSATNLANGDVIIFKDVKGMIELNRRAFKISGLSGTSFNLQTLASVDVNATDWGVYQDGEGMLTENGGLITGATSANPVVVSTNSTGGSNALVDGDTVVVEDVVGMAGINKRTFMVDSVVANTSFSLKAPGLNSSIADTSGDIDGSTYQAYASGSFITESDAWVGESMPIDSVDTTNDYVYLRGRLGFPDLYKTNALISQFTENYKGRIQNIEVSALDDVEDKSVWFRPHAIDVYGIPDMVFEDIRGGKNWAGLTNCRSCPNSRVVNQYWKGNTSMQTFDPTNSDMSLLSTTTSPATNVITGISNATQAVVSYSGGDNWVDGMAFTFHTIAGMTELQDISLIVSDIDTVNNTFKIKRLDDLSYINSSTWGTFTSATVSGASVTASTGAHQVSAVDTGTDVFTTNTMSTSKYADGTAVYVHVPKGDYNALHNSVWLIDQVSTTTFKLYDINNNYFNATNTFDGTDDIWISLADVQGLSYGHSIYGPSYGVIASVTSDGGRHDVTIDGMRASWSSANYPYLGQPTYVLIDNLKSNGANGPTDDDHEEATLTIHKNTSVINSIRGHNLSSYIAMGSQIRGLDATRINFYMQGGQAGVRLAKIEHSRVSYNKVSGFDISGLEEDGSITANPQSYCLRTDTLTGLYNKPILYLEGTNYCSSAGKPVYMDDHGAILGSQATLNLKNIGARAIDMSDGSYDYFEIGALNVDFRRNRAQVTSQVLLNATTVGNQFYAREVNLIMGTSTSNPSSTGLIDVGTGKPYTRIGIDKLKIRNPNMLATIPPLVSDTDYPYVEWATYGPDKIILNSDDETTVLTTGTSKYCTTMTDYFMPTRYTAKVSVVDATQALTFDVNKNGTTVFGTNKLSIDTSEKTSMTAATVWSPVAASVAVYVPGDELCYDIDTATPVGAKGAKIEIEGYVVR